MENRHENQAVAAQPSSLHEAPLATHQDIEKNAQLNTPNSSSPNGEEPNSSLPSQDDAVTYPEGGTRAWLVVFGAWCGMFASFGISNALGSFQAYISANQLSTYSDSQIGWIFSLYLFFLMFGGIYVGPIFDVYGPRWLLLVGSTMIIVMIFVIGVCDSMLLEPRLWEIRILTKYDQSTGSGLWCLVL
jgi:hypothetical protein